MSKLVYLKCLKSGRLKSNEENGNFNLGPEAIDADYDFSEYYVLFFEDEYAVVDEEKVER